MAEAFGIACYELVSLDFHCGSTTVLPRHDRERLFLGDKQTSDSGDLTSESSQIRTCWYHSNGIEFFRPLLLVSWAREIGIGT